MEQFSAGLRETNQAFIVSTDVPHRHRMLDATQEVRQTGEKKKDKVKKMMDEIYIRRTKDVVLAGALPTKYEFVVFCDLSPLQKQVYEHAIQQPDVLNVRMSSAPCDCGVNRKVRGSQHSHSN